MRGSFVRGLHGLVANVYKDAAQLQFREPVALREAGHLGGQRGDNGSEDSRKGGGDGEETVGEECSSSPANEQETGKCII